MKTKNRVLLALMLAVALLSAGQFAQAVELFEDFASDPNWDGLLNRTDPQDYGFSNTDNVGLGAGEAGGYIEREPASYYAVNVGELDPTTTVLHAHGFGVLLAGSGNVRVGWFDKDGNLATGSNLIGFRSDTNELYSQAASGGGGQIGAPGEGNVFEFDMTYDPTTEEITYIINGGTPTVVGLDASAASLGTLDRFGFLSRGADGDTNKTFYYDDLTYTSAIPEPSTSLLLLLGGVACLISRRRVRNEPRRHRKKQKTPTKARRQHSIGWLPAGDERRNRRNRAVIG